MNYTFHFQTKYSDSTTLVGEDVSPDVVFKYTANDDYPQLMCKGLDLVEILNKAKTRFAQLNKENNTWDCFDNALLLKEYDNIEKCLPFNEIRKCAYKKENDLLFKMMNRLVSNMPEQVQINLPKMNLRSKKYDINEIEATNKKYNVFLPVLTSELKKVLRKKKKTNEFDYYYEHMLGNLSSLIKKMINFENGLLKTTKYKQEKESFNNMYKIMYPALFMIYKNKEYDTLDEYRYEISAGVEKFKEERQNIKAFIPIGMCYFNEKLFLNTCNWKKFQSVDKTQNIETVKDVFLHELGHAIDYPANDAPLLKGQEDIPAKEQISSMDEFAKNTRLNYKNAKKLKNRFNKQIVKYYCSPEFKIVDLNDFEAFNNGATVYEDWSRAQDESWAQSFAIISRWLLYGMNRLDTVTLKGNRSTQRILIKTLMPTIQYMLKNLNWEYVGFSKELLKDRMPLVRQLLAKIDTLPLGFSAKDPRCYKKIAKLSRVRKPTRRMLAL